MGADLYYRYAGGESQSLLAQLSALVAQACPMGQTADATTQLAELRLLLD